MVGNQKEFKYNFPLLSPPQPAATAKPDGLLTSDSGLGLQGSVLTYHRYAVKRTAARALLRTFG